MFFFVPRPPQPKQGDQISLGMQFIIPLQTRWQKAFNFRQIMRGRFLAGELPN